MKYIILSAIITLQTLSATTQSSLKIPHRDCLKYPYANIIGGTMHSRHIQKKRLYKRALKDASYTESEALLKIQKNYPKLDIKRVDIDIKNCYIYFKSKNQNGIYYFDAKTLELIRKRV